MSFSLAFLAAATALSVEGVQPDDPTAPETIIVVRAERLSNLGTESQDIGLSAAELAVLPTTRLDEALRSFPGVGLFRRTSSGVANATIQGLSLRPIAPNGAGRALVTLDGVPQNDPFGGWIYWARHDPMFLSQVDVRRGGQGAGFGPMALTGTLDLYEARDTPSRMRISLGEARSLAMAGRTAVVADNGQLTFMGSYERSDGDIPVKQAQRGPVDRPASFEASAGSATLNLATRNDQIWSFRVAAFSETKGAGLIGANSEARGGDLSAAYKFGFGQGGQGRVLVFGQARNFSNSTVSVSAARTIATPALDQFETPSSAIGGSLQLRPNLFENWQTVFTFDARQAEGQTRELFRFIGSSFTRIRVAGGRQDLWGGGVSLTPKSNDAWFGFGGALRLDNWANP